jgi:hypothetical protein
MSSYVIGETVNEREQLVRKGSGKLFYSSEIDILVDPF